MNRHSALLVRVLALLLVFTFCGGPQLAEAWAQGDRLPDAPSVVTQNTPPAPLGNSQPDRAGENGVSNNAPASSGEQGQQPSSGQSVEQPAGVAGAKAGETAGGAASTPAGSAIAPAPQREVRSFLIKVGAIAAAGAAAGVIYALTRGTPSTPPGAPGR